MNHSDRGILYMTAAMTGKLIGMEEWCVYLIIITAGFYAMRAIWQVLSKEGGREVTDIRQTEPQSLVGKACPKDAELRRVCKVFFTEDYGRDKCSACWAACEKQAAQTANKVAKEGGAQ